MAMTTAAPKTPQDLWREEYEGFVRSVNEDYPVAMRGGWLIELVEDSDRVVREIDSLSLERVEDIATALACALPLPLADIPGSCDYELGDLDGLIEVLATELLELRARVATLEEARS